MVAQHRIDAFDDNDLLARLTREAWFTAGATTQLLTFAYDAQSSVTSAQSYAGAYTMAYDAVDRLTVCGGFAKLSKLAAGHLDLHSARSQVDKGFLAELAR